MQNLNLPRIAQCLALGVAASVLLWVTVLFFHPVILAVAAVVMAVATAGLLQTDTVRAWVHNLIAYLLGLTLSLLVERGLNFFQFLYALKFPDAGTPSVSEWFGVVAVGKIYLGANLLGAVGSFVMAKKRLENKG